MLIQFFPLALQQIKYTHIYNISHKNICVDLFFNVVLIEILNLDLATGSAYKIIFTSAPFIYCRS